MPLSGSRLSFINLTEKLVGVSEWLETFKLEDSSAATVVPVVCRRFAQLCEIGPIDFLRSLYVDSTIQDDFGHVVRSSVGCLGSEIFWVMCLNLHIPDNAEKHCFEHKSQFLILKY